jgi:hypothetical protein
MGDEREWTNSCLGMTASGWGDKGDERDWDKFLFRVDVSPPSHRWTCISSRHPSRPGGWWRLSRAAHTSRPCWHRLGPLLWCPLVVVSPCFPSLSSLKLDSNGWAWGVGVGPAMVRAFDGIAPTLKTLTLRLQEVGAEGEGEGEAAGVLQRLGEAIGRLHRLETLRLKITAQGTAYHRLAQGLAEGSCPSLRSLTIAIGQDAAWLACRPSIIRPRVQHFCAIFGDLPGSEPFALVGALTVLDYRGEVVMVNVPHGGVRDHVIEILKPRLADVGFLDSCFL